MLAVLPAIAVAFLYLAVRGSTGAGRRVSLLWTLVAAGGYATLVAESLSLVRAFSVLPVAIAWALPAVGLAGWWFRKGRRAPVPKPFADAPIVTGFIALVAAEALVIALVAPPNTIDALSYHMSRVAHWMANGSVAHYPTHIPRQLYLAPFAEYAIAQLQVLAGSDRFANLPQWGAMIGSIAAVSLLAGRLGADGRTRRFAVLAAITIPTGIVQATGPSNNWVAGLWLLIFLHEGLAFADGGDLRRLVLAAAALGLGVLTKGTVLIFALPLAAWIAARSLPPLKRRPAAVLLAVAIVLAINAGHLLRNTSTFGAPLGPAGEGDDPALRLVNESARPAGIAANLVRNLGLHLRTSSGTFNRIADGAIRSGAGAAGFDLDPPGFTYGSGTLFDIRVASRDEDLSGAPLHVLLIAAALVLALAGRHDRGTLLAGLAGFLLFCLLLRWQPWHGRLHLPLIVLMLPASAVLLSRFGARTLAVFGLLLAVGALPYLFKGDPRPLVGWDGIFAKTRRSLYFQNRRELEGPYVEACARIDDGRHPVVGLIMSADDLEYPLWALTGGRVRFGHVGVKGAVVGPWPATLLVFSGAAAPALPGYRRDGGTIGLIEIWTRGK